MRKLPFRPEDRQITQPYRDGVVKIYTITDAAQPGYQPKPTPALVETPVSYTHLTLPTT